MTASYFRRNETNGDASRLLVAATVNRNSDNNTVESVDHGHAMYSLLLSSFASELSKHQQRVFTALLFYTKVHGAANKANTTMLPLRVSEEPKEIVQYHLADRKRLEPLVDLPYSAAVRTLHGSSPRGKTLAASCSEDSKDAIPVEVVLWSDDFDPNNTQKKQGIGTPQDDYHSGCNAYLLSLEPSSRDERAVKSKIAEELIALSQPTSFYWPVDSLKGKEVKIALQLLSTLQDRPERSSWVCFTYGNGRYGGRFGWAVDLSQGIAFKNLPSCAECHNSRMTNGQQRRRPQCNCADWNMMFIIFKIPKNYPSFKIFLSCIQFFDALRQQKSGENGKDRIPKWRTTFNYLGLLNYPDLVREHGPVRPLSELDFKCGALIQLLTKRFSSGTHGETLAYNVANAYYKDKSFRNVLRDAKPSFLSSMDEELFSEPATLKILQAIDQEIKEGTTKGGETRIEDEMICNTNSNFVRYKDIETANRHLFTRNNLITGIVMENARYFVLVGRNREEERYYQIEPDMYHISLCGADYFIWRICSDDEVKDELEKIRVQNSTHYFLVLPLLNNLTETALTTLAIRHFNEFGGFHITRILSKIA